jgi:hypothetical protein
MSTNSNAAAYVRGRRVGLLTLSRGQDKRCVTDQLDRALKGYVQIYAKEEECFVTGAVCPRQPGAFIRVRRPQSPHSS